MPTATPTATMPGLYRQVLAAIDLLESDIDVLRTAFAIAQRSDAGLTVLHVCEGPVTGYGPATANHHIANDMQAKQAYYPTFKALLDKARIGRCTEVLLTGRPADTIHQYAREHGCDLIVVGSHGYAGVKALLGSTAHQALHGAPCDVYTVRIRE